ncbi:Rad21 protein [Coprinopsis cinerea okayama7|uniref:Rad21 protein n=1 Tax=Coprinopsis cinerea (strain Okayama-7 / 130 / ATCC MYA-4618 / FGSC 9003) TaxID=240176 RepID=A8N1V9_COPC7|nr:Rad21 protein [Coprinopsis cinerea okayama7\|eukprot:XP_001828858.2 Rad21 protein [Coprinopsis cinerea okayama7\
MERKLSKSQTLQTDIEQSVDAIKDGNVEVLALRLSGQLLLGVVRIYSRKAKYLLDDCNDALLKIKMASTIDINLLLPDDNWDMDIVDRPLREQGQHQAQIEDITLPQGNNLDQFGAIDPFDIGPTDGIGSQDFLDIDLGIDWDEAPQKASEDGMSVDDLSVGVGRDAASVHSLRDFPHLNGVNKSIDLQSIRSFSRDPSEQPFQPTMDMDFPDFGGMDLGDLGIGFDQPAEEPVIEPLHDDKAPSSRSLSPLTEIPDTPVAEEIPLPEVPEEPIKPAKKPREKKQIIDSVTEMYDGPGASSSQANRDGPMKDVSNIITEQRYLPRSSLALRLQEIREDPLAHFLPTKTVDNHLFFSAGPPGLTSELTELFLRPMEPIATKRRYASVTEDGSKRIRLDEDEVEAGRRAMSIASSVAGMSDKLGEEHNVTGDFDFADQTAALDEYQLELPNEDGNVDITLGARERSVSLAPSARSRLSTPGAEGWMEGEESYADMSCPIAMFDSRQPATQTQTQEESEVVETQEVVAEEKGYSKNTVKALSFIRKELQPTLDDGAQDSSMSFNAMATKVSQSNN